jgi:hypothetical protein
MAFISLHSAADRLGTSVDYLRDLIDRMDRIPRVRYVDPAKNFWEDDDGLLDEQDLKTYATVLRQRRCCGVQELLARGHASRPMWWEPGIGRPPDCY